MVNPNHNTIPPRNPNEPAPAQRSGDYILPLAIAAIVLAIGIMFFTVDSDVDDLAATAPAAGTMESSTLASDQQGYQQNTNTQRPINQ